MIARAYPLLDGVPDGIFRGALSREQRAAIRQGIQVGRTIYTMFPGIADDYRAGRSLAKIVEDYAIEGTFGVSFKTASMAVSHALRGYDGHLEIAGEPSYAGLITDAAELEQLAREHNAESSRQLGMQLKAEGRGIFSLSTEERRRIGRASGLKQYRDRIGIHAQTPEERRAIGRMGRAAQGFLQYTEEEIAYVIRLAETPAYRRITRIHAKKIAAEINSRFHGGKAMRSPESITKAYYRAQKQEGGKDSSR